MISVFYKELDPVLVGEGPMPHTLQPGQGVLISCPRWTKESEIVVLYVGHRHLTRLWACRFDGMQGSSSRAFDGPILANPSWRTRGAMAYSGGIHRSDERLPVPGTHLSIPNPGSPIRRRRSSSR